MEKRGWTRIVEAIIAIMIIASALIVITQTQEKNKSEKEYVTEIERTILTELAANSEMREKVIEENESAIEKFVRERMPLSLNFSVKICNVSDVCNLESVEHPPDKNIYAEDIMISSSLADLSWKKVKIFAWRK